MFVGDHTLFISVDSYVIRNIFISIYIFPYIIIFLLDAYIETDVHSIEFTRRNNDVLALMMVIEILWILVIDRYGDSYDT